MIFFFSDGRVEDHPADLMRATWILAEPMEPWVTTLSASNNATFCERHFTIQWFDWHLRRVGRGPRWVAYVEDGHLDAVLMGARAAEAIGHFAAGLS